MTWRRRSLPTAVAKGCSRALSNRIKKPAHERGQSSQIIRTHGLTVMTRKPKSASRCLRRFWLANSTSIITPGILHLDSRSPILNFHLKFVCPPALSAVVASASNGQSGASPLPGVSP